MTKKKKTEPAPEPQPRDTRSLIERAAQDDPVLSVHFELVETDGLLHCRLCDFVTPQPHNARNHVGLRHQLEETLRELKPSLEELAGAMAQYAEQHNLPTLAEYIDEHFGAAPQETESAETNKPPAKKSQAKKE